MRRCPFAIFDMLIGAFFSEVGTSLQGVLSEMDPKKTEIKEKLVVKVEWEDLKKSLLKPTVMFALLQLP